MQPNLISAEEFCRHYRIEQSFLTALQEYGLAEIIYVQEQCYIDENYLEALERWRRLHYDLQINMEGLHAISHLLKRVQLLQEETNRLRNRLRRYEQATLPEDRYGA